MSSNIAHPEAIHAYFPEQAEPIKTWESTNPLDFTKQSFPSLNGPPYQKRLPMDLWKLHERMSWFGQGMLLCAGVLTACMAILGLYVGINGLFRAILDCIGPSACILILGGLLYPYAIHQNVVVPLAKPKDRDRHDGELEKYYENKILKRRRISHG